MHLANLLLVTEEHSQTLADVQEVSPLMVNKLFRRNLRELFMPEGNNETNVVS